MCRLAAAWADGVVPLGQNVVRFELQSLKLFRTGFGASGVMSAVQIGRNGQAGCRRGRTDKVKDLLVAIERFARPVFGDFGEEPMLDGIPLGSASGVVSDGDVEMKAIGELSLQFRFPSPAATTVAATRVGKNEQLAGMGILGKSFTLPPMGDGVSGESGGVVRDANDDGPAVVDGLIDAIRDSDTQSVGEEVMIIDQSGRAVPTGPRVFKVADHLALFGIDANDRHAAALEALA